MWGGVENSGSQFVHWKKSARVASVQTLCTSRNHRATKISNKYVYIKLFLKWNYRRVGLPYSVFPYEVLPSLQNVSPIVAFAGSDLNIVVEEQLISFSNEVVFNLSQDESRLLCCYMPTCLEQGIVLLEITTKIKMLTHEKINSQRRTQTLIISMSPTMTPTTYLWL